MIEGALVIIMGLCFVWLMYEAWTAPLMDDNYDNDDDAGQK